MIETRNKTKFLLRELGAQTSTLGWQNNTKMAAAELYIIICATFYLKIGVQFYNNYSIFPGSVII
jgi:hypothetical protein